MRHEAAGITTDNFPPALQLGPNRFALDYHFEPGSPRDGVTHDRAARAAQPGAGGALRVAGAGPAEGEGARAGEVDRRSACATSSGRSTSSPRRSARRCRRRTCRCADAVRRYVAQRIQSRHAGRRVAPRLGAAAPAHELPGARRGRPPARRWDATCRAEEGVSAGRRRRSCERKRRSRGRAATPAGPWATCPS